MSLYFFESIFLVTIAHLLLCVILFLKNVKMFNLYLNFNFYATVLFESIFPVTVAHLLLCIMLFFKKVKFIVNF